MRWFIRRDILLHLFPAWLTVASFLTGARHVSIIWHNGNERNVFIIVAQEKPDLCITIECKHRGKPWPKMHPCTHLPSQPGWPNPHLHLPSISGDSQQRGWYVEQFFRFSQRLRMISNAKMLKHPGSPLLGQPATTTWRGGGRKWACWILGWWWHPKRPVSCFTIFYCLTPI